MASGTTPTTTRAVVVVGGGMLGAAVAERLADAGRAVTLLESAPALGGLAGAWTLDTGTGPLTWDRFYHVVLGQDRRVRRLLEELGVPVHFGTAGSELLAGGQVHPMSSVVDLLTLPVLDPLSRIRVGATVALGALTPVRWGERTTSARWLARWSGPAATRELWLPLLRAKLGEQAEAASARFIRSTFRRLLTARLQGGDGDRFGWIEGGYAAVLTRLGARLATRGVDVRTRAAVSAVRRTEQGRWSVTVDGQGELLADEVVLTVPGPIARRLVPDLPAEQADRLDRVPYLGCVCVSVVLNRPLTGGYLMYVTDETPYTAVVEMTNLVDPAHLTAPSATGTRHLIYLPRYCSPDDPAFTADEAEVIERCLSDLITRYPDLRREHVLGTGLARARYVMPVPTPGRGDDAPPVTIGPPGLYLASSAQVVDGTLNVETTLALAERAVAEILSAHLLPERQRTAAR